MLKNSLIALILLLFSCDSDDFYSSETTFGMNDEKWNFSIRAKSVENGFSLLLDGRAENKESDLVSINIFNIPTEEGEFTILNKPRTSGLTSGFLSFIDQDVTLELYSVDDSDHVQDFISITNKTGRTIEGFINLSLKKFTNYEPQSPDSIIIKLGSFRCRIER